MTEPHVKEQTHEQEPQPAPPADDGAAAAKDAAQQAAEHAKETAAEALKVFQGFDAAGKSYVVGMLVVLVCSLVFRFYSIDISSAGAVSPMVAKMQTEMERAANSAIEPVGQMGFWGMLLVLSSVAGIGLFMWSAMTKQSAAWLPLAHVGAAALCTLVLLAFFLWAGRLSDGNAMMRDYLEPDIDMTLLGFWVPLAAAVTATAASVKRILRA